MAVSTMTIDICEKSMAGNRLSNNELMHLFNLELFSEDYYHLMWARDRINFESADGVAEVQTQIVIDANPCHIDCEFCSLAESVNHRQGDMNMPLEEILEYVRAFMRQKVNGICVMATADYDFQRYLDVIAAVRKETGGETPLMVNIADFDYSQALELKNAGIRSIYHAVRMGEGVVNKAEIEIRFKTMIAAKEAGILLGAGVEMIAPAYADKDVVQIMQRQIDLEPHMAGCKARIRVPGTKMEKTPTYIKAKHDLYAASYRLLISTAAPFCAENCRWSSR